MKIELTYEDYKLLFEGCKTLEAMSENEADKTMYGRLKEKMDKVVIFTHKGNEAPLLEVE
ncbi:hypothetical protein SAMN02745751_03171 [Dethiosulfatibacter aminovorans DSM 17477]|uniref:Uncharacterized protein n=1 Tax=Dethiosulfatibacter aminovorans DSM 17477 TaxID=1121476 RepID=A0A1M6LH48_9FIRM|nr:hypothetical protein [Dethiosulfatibacter aminovorans]SHJ70468.1 hypothetical protein SAMN02745751_03171 [Dethiosulfatibacter aminovorans DSM 17477]